MTVYVLRSLSLRHTESQAGFTPAEESSKFPSSTASNGAAPSGISSVGAERWRGLQRRCSEEP